MSNTYALLIVTVTLAMAACGRLDTGGDATRAATDDAMATADPIADAAPASDPVADPVEIVPGLTMSILRQGDGEMAVDGNIAVVHYTGWLLDETAPQNRGRKFDSSVDRGQHFEFLLGAGRVIPGWDKGVAGMLVGEVRELTIASELAYGERGFGNVIPPGATLVFEVELADAKTPPAETE